MAQGMTQADSPVEVELTWRWDTDVGLNFALSSGTSVVETATSRPERSSVRRLRGDVQ